MILIVGGSGTLGGFVVRALLGGQHPVRILTRDPQRVSMLADAGATVIKGDLLDPRSIERACTGVRAIVCAAHSITGRGTSASVQVDGAAHRRLIDTAARVGVEHIVYTSAYDYGPAWHAIPFWRIKLEVEAYLEQSGIPFTILRPTAFMDFHAHVLIGEPVIRKGKVTLFGRGDRPRNFVAAQDVAHFVVRGLADPSFVGQTIDVGGPGNHSNMDVVRLYEHASGRRAKIRHVPLAVPRMAWPMIRPFHQGLSQIVQSAVLAETTEQSFDARPLEARFRVRLTPLDEWIAQRLRTVVIPERT